MGSVVPEEDSLLLCRLHSRCRQQRCGIAHGFGSTRVLDAARKQHQRFRWLRVTSGVTWPPEKFEVR